VAPKLIGGDGRPALAPLGVRRLADAPTLVVRRVRRFGDDILIEARR
jgi:riboflavin biosynthesis pyrimidine reductase